MFSQLFKISSYYFNPYSIPVCIVGILILCIGFFVLKQNKDALTNLACFLQCFSTGFWLLSISVVYSLKAPELAIFFYRYFTFFGVINIMPSLIFLGSALLGEFEKRKQFVIANFVIAFIFYFLAITTNKIVISYNIRKYFWGFYPIYGKLTFIFLFIYFAQFIVGMARFYNAYKNENTLLKKKQIRTLGIATLIAFPASIDFIPKLIDFPLYPFGYIFMFTYIIIVSYAIVKYRAFDIETVFHKTAIWILSFSFIVIPALLLDKLFFSYMQHSHLLRAIFWAACFIAIVIYLRVIQPRIDNLFQRRKFDLEIIARKFSDDLIQLKGLHKLIERIENVIAFTLYPQSIQIFIHNQAEDSYRHVNIAPNVKQSIFIYKSDIFLNWLAVNNRIVHSDFIDIDPRYENIRESAKNYINSTNATIIIPLALNEKLLGVINLTKKQNLRRYTASDINFLTSIRNESTIAISNSLLYEHMEEQVKERTQELMQVQKQLIQAEKLATVGTLAGGVAHEINNPLTAVLTNVQMLLMSDQINPVEDRESLELIEEATKRCRTIVQKLMAYAKKPLESTDFSLIDLLKATNNVVNFLNYQMEQENIRINIIAQEPTYIINGNQNEIEQVITNIILNAKDAIKNIKPGGAINIVFAKTADKVRLKISDEGKGIPDKIITKIFDPFFTTKDVGKGLGLGLSICQAIMEKHAGLITVESKIGKGTTFVLDFANKRL